MKIYALYDNRRPDSELALLRTELARQGIEDYQATWGLNHCRTAEENINFNHKVFIKLAKHHGEPEVCIMEVDCMFPAEDGWQYFLRRMPKYFDIYSAGTYGLDMDKLRREGSQVADVDKLNGIHCYIVRQRFYDTFLDTSPCRHLDQALDGLGAYCVCYPFAAIQRPGWSANAPVGKKEVDYNTPLRKEDVYGW